MRILDRVLYYVPLARGFKGFPGLLRPLLQPHRGRQGILCGNKEFRMQSTEARMQTRLDGGAHGES